MQQEVEYNSVSLNNVCVWSFK